MIPIVNALPDVPEQIKAPADAQLVLRARACGFQIYVCQAGLNQEPVWNLRAPEAKLYDQDGNLIGRHYAGPTWKHQDGSEITARVTARVDSPDAGAIPWLLLLVTSHRGDGMLNRVTSIHRIHTVGGQPPAAHNLGHEVRVPYEAVYYFYASS